MPASRSSFRAGAAAAVLPLLLFLPAWLAAAPAPAADPARDEPRLERAREHLDNGRAEEALELLDAVLGKRKPSAEALLLRSTGRVMMGDLQGGYEDLERAVEIDPALRQAWLNLAGLEIADGRYDAAERALREARALDPAASDSYLNLGAVLVLQDRVEEAADSFRRYLEIEGASAGAHYLVAANYALAQYEEPAIEHLRRAIELDERVRLKARSDARFLQLEGPRYAALLAADPYTPPDGHHTAAAAFRVPYDQRDNRLLYAVLDVLAELRVPYDPGVEATADWALVWGAMRIKVWNQENGTGVVSASAPPEAFTANEWQRQTQTLFQKVQRHLDKIPGLR